jgi:glycosyltransferase involved in cell wall biosynthesis
MIVGARHAGELSVKGVHILPVEAAMIDEPFEQFQLPGVLSELAPDVYLNTTFSVPAVKTTRVQMAVVHDVVFEDRPDFVEPRLRSYLSRWSRFSAAHADHVLTVSDHARARIQDVYGTEPARLTRVYNGISPSCFELPPEREVERVRAHFGLKGPFILYLGTVEPKKGVVELLRAYRDARERGLAHTLVLAGGQGGKGFDLEAHIRATGCEGKVRSLGFVDEADKKPLLQACDLFVYPSLYEGFGFPPLEAMALGTPCVVSNLTSLPEIVGDAACATPVEDTSAFAAALLRCASDEGFRSAAASAGPARAKEFSWERSAAQVLDLCERLGGN